MKNIFEQKVSYCDTDAYGVVWHGSYLRWLEIGRMYFCDDIGLAGPECVVEFYFAAVFLLCGCGRGSGREIALVFEGQSQGVLGVGSLLGAVDHGWFANSPPKAVDGFGGVCSRQII